MKLRDLIFMSLLVGIGFVLHAVVPGFFFGMKPDIMLVMMILGIILYQNKKHVLVLSLLTGIITALTTTFPGGQLPNVIDKLGTGFLVLLLLLIIRKDTIIIASIVTFVGTLISGAIFLLSALIIAGLPVPFTVLFITVVFPTAIINTILMSFIYPIVSKLKKQMLK